MQKGRHLLVGALLVLGYFAGLPPHSGQTLPDFDVPVKALGGPQAGDAWREMTVSDANTLLVHAASVAELPDGRLRAVWFAGTREGARDVSISTALFDPETAIWSPETVAVSRQQMMDGLGRYVRKLGNAVLSVEPDGGMRLFVVTVSFGGWGASRISVLESQDQGETWTDPKLLVTTPFANISNLVKGGPIRYSDGSIGLPIYHEFLGKFGEVLRLDRDNRVLSKARIGFGRGAIQPVLVISGPRSATAFMRNEMSDTSAGVWRSDSKDAGKSWSPLFAAGLANPSAAISAAQLSSENWLMAANCNAHERDDLCLKGTDDGGDSWHLIEMFHDRSSQRAAKVQVDLLMQQLAAELEDDGGVADLDKVLGHARKNKCHGELCEFQYDYPYMLRTRNGDIHILYTWNKTLSRHLWWQADQSRTDKLSSERPVTALGGAQ